MDKQREDAMKTDLLPGKPPIRGSENIITVIDVLLDTLLLAQSPIPKQ